MAAMKTTLFFNNSLSSSSSSSSLPYHPTKKNGQKYIIITVAKKKDSPENSRTQQQNSILPLKISYRALAKSAIAVFGLGFIDAGYSGDWSRIGVISKESEDLLKLAAFAVIPLCIFLIFSISREQET
ncbi:conserved hypothetical protein [Ricinus communis]|uniref:DUF7887 domain-containing protein n=1 Tax=Ricinus communis TaxID=3988 RepID=B9SQX1_RICCO|nr:conserved hypothetical protein [Ricinus communis]|eukprot:XP_002528390.1 uncharacterized protein LOC8265767 isoform X1 [Ricinus communis]